MTKGNQAGVY